MLPAPSIRGGGFANKRSYRCVSAILTGDVTFEVLDFVPNPTANLTNLLITSNVSQEVRVELYNLIGERMLDRNVLLNKGGNNVPFNLNALASGTYTALVHTGNEVHTRKVLVQSNPPCSLLAKAALYAAFFMFYWAC